MVPRLVLRLIDNSLHRVHLGANFYLKMGRIIKTKIVNTGFLCEILCEMIQIFLSFRHLLLLRHHPGQNYECQQEARAHEGRSDCCHVDRLHRCPCIRASRMLPDLPKGQSTVAVTVAAAGFFGNPLPYRLHAVNKVLSFSQTLPLRSIRPNWY